MPLGHSLLRMHVEVCCGHLGFGTDPATLWLIADRLAVRVGRLWAVGRDSRCHQQDADRGEPEACPLHPAQRLHGSRVADAVAQVRDVLRELLDLRGGRPADQVELEVLRRQVAEQLSPLPEQDRYDVQFQLVELPGPRSSACAAWRLSDLLE